MPKGDGMVNTGGIELHLTDSSAVLTKCDGLQSCNDPEFEVGEEENTDQDSGGFKSYIPSMKDIPDLVAKFKLEPGSPTDVLIQEHKASGEKRPFKIVVPKEDGTTEEATGVLFIKSYTKDDGALGSLKNATLTARPGPITRA